MTILLRTIISTRHRKW